MELDINTTYTQMSTSKTGVIGIILGDCSDVTILIVIMDCNLPNGTIREIGQSVRAQGSLLFLTMTSITI